MAINKTQIILIKHLSTVVLIVLAINFLMTWLLLFFHQIFSSHIQATTDITNFSLATTHELLINEFIYLYLTAYLVPILAGIYIHYPLLKAIGSKELKISQQVKTQIINLPITLSKVILYGWFFSIFQIMVLVFLDLIPSSGFITTNLAVQLTISVAAYAFTFFALDIYNKRIFFTSIFKNDNSMFSHENKALSFRNKIQMLFLAVVLFPCALFGIIIYFLLITEDSVFINNQYPVLFFMLFVVIAFGWSLSEMLLATFKHSFKELNVATKKISNGDYDINLKITSFDEIGYLMDSLNNMAYEIGSLNKDIVETQKEIIFMMGAIGESRSKETGNHVKRVAEYSRVLAVEYGLSRKESEILKQASPMHDIGKVAIPDSILNKPGPLTADEREIMDSHAVLGYDMLRSSNRDILQAAAIVAYEHHEKWDGTGYPNNKVGDNIHIYGRITAIADVFDALGSNRVYKEAWSDEQIFQLLNEQKGKHFDPELIDIFFNKFHLFNEIRSQFDDHLPQESH
ncbi:hypothetical protein GCM10008107_11700 [Psychrosphaera saromensis]|uniref:HD domain-containing phosphohydrolase n=1 Tax=Psychrosphaera saromensis TaxID=716813 RepID=UPI000CF490EE|nr:HD domain-containing phosphohydrolase [Psychrosphaera saromensis]GHB64218.1 hypothetical protein GCM10008107_11700 [Psychrosphaera saromensis]GLQ15673.1 hypothetical protein GCM10007917_31280 [Psychrosphaera saromensis]